jgi:quercetin dioxygenase-like cupin family protein
MRYILLVLTGLFLLTACAQEEAEVVEDVLKAAPDKASTLFDNDFVRMDKFTLEPGEALPLHKGGPRAVYALSDYTIKWTEGDRVSEQTWQRGDAHWHDAVPHAAENVGDGDAVYLTVTRKEMGLPADAGYDTAQDAGELDTEHAGVAFENDHVRVIEVELGPGESQPLHHGVNRLVYSLSDYRIEYTSDQMDTKEMTMAKGEAHWHGADEHAVENVGETPAHYVIFEFLK